MLGLQANRFPGKPGGGPLSAPDSGLVGGWPRLLVPGMPALPPGDERYLVRGGGSVTFALEPDDEVTVTDKEGRQACEIVTFDAAGQPAAGLLGTASDGPALGL